MTPASRSLNTPPPLFSIFPTPLCAALVWSLLFSSAADHAGPGVCCGVCMVFIRLGAAATFRRPGRVQQARVHVSGAGSRGAQRGELVGTRVWMDGRTPRSPLDGLSRQGAPRREEHCAALGARGGWSAVSAPMQFVLVQQQHQLQGARVFWGASWNGSLWNRKCAYEKAKVLTCSLLEVLVMS